MEIQKPIRKSLVGLWSQSNINFPSLFMKVNSRKLSEVPPISMVNFNLRWKELNFSNNSLRNV